MKCRGRRLTIGHLVAATLLVGLVLGVIVGRLRHPARADEWDRMIVASIAIVALSSRRISAYFHRARLLTLARRFAPPPCPNGGSRPDHAAFLESRHYRDVRTPRPLLRSRP